MQNNVGRKIVLLAKGVFSFIFPSRVVRHYVNTEIIGLAPIQSTVSSAFPKLYLLFFFPPISSEEVLKIYDRLRVVIFSLVLFYHGKRNLVHIDNIFMWLHTYLKMG